MARGAGKDRECRLICPRVNANYFWLSQFVEMERNAFTKSIDEN